jgi:tetratricopeptide (TPR) repeat protein
MRNVALILIETGKIEEAKTAISEARKENPTDDGLIVSEADIYLKLNDIPTYQRLIKEALDKNPNDAVLIFNLGVTSANNKQYDEAEKYYKKVIEIDPKYVDAYLNLSDAMLKPDQKMVDEMAKLGYTEKDQKRFDVLKVERQKLFNKVLPYLEKAHELKPDNKEVINGLITVYKFLERMDKVKEMKAKL